MSSSRTAVRTMPLTAAALMMGALAVAVPFAGRHLAHAATTTAPVAATRPAAGPLSVHLDAVQTCDGLGACQGASSHDGFVYLYGDAKPNGVIRQYRVDPASDGSVTPHLTYTDLQIDLTYQGQNLINHPTGLTWNAEFGTYLGNTVTRTKSGTIYHLDWPRMLIDRNLDHAILNVVADDLAIQGCRPEFVRHDDRWLLATADYGHVDNAVRLYDPVKLAAAKRTSDAGVLVERHPCGPFVQNLHWVDTRGTLLVIHNPVEGRRWRLVAADLWTTPDLRTLPPYDDFTNADELEGFTMLDPDRCLFVTSSRRDNVTVAHIRLPAGRTADAAAVTDGR